MLTRVIRALCPKSTECGSATNDQTLRMLSSLDVTNLVTVLLVEPALREAETQVAKNEVKVGFATGADVFAMAIGDEKINVAKLPRGYFSSTMHRGGLN